MSDFKKTDNIDSYSQISCVKEIVVAPHIVLKIVNIKQLLLKHID